MVPYLQCHICSVPYLNNGTPLPLMIWHGQATSCVNVCVALKSRHGSLEKRNVANINFQSEELYTRVLYCIQTLYAWDESEY